MNGVFFPLHSSAGWFESEQTAKELEQHLKMAVFCFDKVVLENGTYDVTITENGGFEAPWPSLPVERRRLRFDKGENFSFAIRLPKEDEDYDPHGAVDAAEYTPLVEGAARVSYLADFYPLLAPAGIVDESCFGGLATRFRKSSKTKPQRGPLQTELTPSYGTKSPFIISKRATSPRASITTRLG